MDRDDEILDTLKKIVANQDAALAVQREQFALAKKAVETQDWFKRYYRKVIISIIVLAALVAAVALLLEHLPST